MSKTASAHADVYTRVTSKILADLESGVRPWERPWKTPVDGRMPLLPLRGNGTPYRGVNVLLLWDAAVEGGFSCNTWMTYKQAEEKGAHVRKGERGSMVVYADRFTKTETGEDGTDTQREIAFMKAYTVFNAQQIDGLPSHDTEPTAPIDEGRLPVLIEEAETFFAETGAVFRHGGSSAFYAPSQDVIQLPLAAAFRDAESYAATKAHELIHWTGHEARNARTFGKRFGDDAYAFEELVAELGAAFLCAELGVTPEIREDHAAYLAHWLRVLKQDKRAIFTAASQAQAAVDYLHTLQPVPRGPAA